MGSPPRHGTAPPPRGQTVVTSVQPKNYLLASEAAAPPRGGGWEGASPPSPPHFGLLGHGLAHTLSPAMFSAVLSARLPGADYRVFDIAPPDLEQFVRSAHEAGIAGFNVTIPHKVTVLPLLDSLDETAAALGAVNCVAFDRKGRSTGYNTDAPAFEACIRSLDRRFDSALVLGAGGAARAVVFALRQLGVPLIVLAERRASLELPGDGLARLGRIPFDARSLAQEAPSFSLIVNCTPVGMYPDVETSPMEQGFRPDQVVFDLVYRPRPTRLLQLASAAGATPVDGLCMLARQAALSLRTWTGLDVPFREFLHVAEESSLLAPPSLSP